MESVNWGTCGTGSVLDAEKFSNLAFACCGKIEKNIVERETNVPCSWQVPVPWHFLILN